VRQRTIILGAIIAVLVAVPTTVGALSRADASGKVTVRIVGANNGQDVTNGGVAGRGHFTATGAITDKGTVVGYRTVTGNLDTGHALIKLRLVTAGKRGKITFVVKIVIEPTTTTSRWTIASGTRAYRGLRGKGTEHENADHTVSTLTGTVSR
jgi:hypothetical protein